MGSGTMIRDIQYFTNYIYYKKSLPVYAHELKTLLYENRTEEAERLKSKIRLTENSMKEIEALIENYNAGANERLFLRCRYIDGLTMEKTAEIMNVSRDTVFRLKKRINRQIDFNYRSFLRASSAFPQE